MERMLFLLKFVLLTLIVTKSQSLKKSEFNLRPRERDVVSRSKKEVELSGCKEGVNQTQCRFSGQLKVPSQKFKNASLSAIQGDQPNIQYCFCNKFATRGMQCNPDAPYKPCNCLPNFAGRRCERCMPGFYQFPNCLPCKCNPEGSSDMVCDKKTGRCPCKVRIRGMKCDLCPLSHYDFPRCKACQCNSYGSYSYLCNDMTGQCDCRPGVYGRRCNKCPPGYYNFPFCWWCGCNLKTTTKEICNENGNCLCKTNFKGKMCDECGPGYYSYPQCTGCDCKSGFGTCGKSGECICYKGFTGRSCDKCAQGFYGFPTCMECACNPQGSHSSLNCHQTTGKCQCKINVVGQKCDSCAKGLVGFPDCRKCSCNPIGTRPRPGGGTTCFGVGDMRCLCKANVEGKTCDRCRYGFYDFNAKNPATCSPCACSSRGSLAGVRGCDFKSGTCSCKSYVKGTKCETCKHGTYGLLSRDLFGCRECSCNNGGSVHSNCNIKTGQCKCHINVDGTSCDRISPSSKAFFPTLYHIKTELEDAIGNNGIPVLTGSDQSAFPSFSGIGYVTPQIYLSFSVDIKVPVTTFYQVIIHYALKNQDSTRADVSLSPKGVVYETHRISQLFRPTSSKGPARSRHITLVENGRNKEISLTKGMWTISFNCRSTNLLLDYLVLLPEEYYKAFALRHTTLKPCKAYPSFNKYCSIYKYYSTKNSHIVYGTHGFVGNGLPAYKYTKRKFELQRIDFGNSISLLGQNQTEIYFEIQEQKAGLYVLVVRYLQPGRQVQYVDVRHGKDRGTLVALPCDYRFACKQVVTDIQGGPMKFKLKGNLFRNKVRLISPLKARLGIISITVLEQSQWNATHVTPFFHCYFYRDRCIKTLYSTPIGTATLIRRKPRPLNDKMVIVNGVVEEEGKYHILIHYKLTDFIESKGEVLIFTNGRQLTLHVTLTYCPALDGCRTKIISPNIGAVSYRKGVASVMLDFPKQVHIKNVLLVPEKALSLEVTKPFPDNKIKEFLRKCSKMNFYTNPNQRQNVICLSGIFTMTLSFLGRVPLCDCDPRGSISLKCKSFGGQCTCRKNVVGRTCNRCPVGYSGFPYCRRCSCSDVGSISQECDVSGKCSCLPGFGGTKCDRCFSSAYYGYPQCKKCNCNGYGSLSVFCSQKSGQCQCRRNFGGVKCDRCRIGYFDFPTCKQCNCNPAGMLVLPGQENTCGNVNDQSCTCKANVQGAQCGECKDLYFGLSAFDPAGCKPCQCSTNGTLGSISTCNKVNGDCLCKQHVTGRGCSRCENGYFNLMEWDIFGCTKCSCNSGGSRGPYCDGLTGQCLCLRGIAGRMCDSVIRDRFFYHDLHEFKIELEDATDGKGKPVVIRDNESRFPGFTWKGYTELSRFQTRIQVTTTVPRTTRYRIIFHYSLSGSQSADVLLKFEPIINSGYLPLGRPKPFQVGIRFQPTVTWNSNNPQFLTVLDSQRIPVEVLLSRGKWKLLLAARPSYIFLDHLVLLPEEYYKPTVLRKDVTNKCQVGGPPDEYCIQYDYPSMDRDGFVTIQAEKSFLTGRKSDLVQPPFQGVTLRGYQNVLTMQLPRDHPTGMYIAVGTFYYEDFPNLGRLDITWLSNRQIQRGWFSIFTCRYLSACRQVAIDDNKEVKVFETSAKSSFATITLRTSLTIALDSITVIPKAKWQQEYLLSAPRCVKYGKSCIQSTFTIPERGVVIQAENNTNTKKNGHVSPRPSYLLNSKIELAYIQTNQRTIYLNVRSSPGSYFVLVHFFQPNFLSFSGSVIVSHSGLALASRVDFRYCPYVSGCRSVGTSITRGTTKNRIFINRETELLVTVTIPQDKAIWIDYILLVPTDTFLLSLLEADQVDMTPEFMNKCAKNHFFIKPSASQFCLDSVFAMTTRFNSGGTPCECNKLGSLSEWCQSYRGQCRCKINVIGRTCNSCKAGYIGFPNCRRR